VNRLRFRMRGCGWRVALAAWACALSSVAQAQLWAYVDTEGFFHFADHPVDARYTRWLDSPVEPALAGSLARARAGNTRLQTYFQISVPYRAVRHHVRDAAAVHGLDVELLKAVISAESGFNPRAISHRGAVGLMQLMPTTAETLGVTPLPGQNLVQRLMDPRTNVHAGALLLARQLARFGDLELALAAYNAGEGAVLRARRQVPDYPETRRYVQKVMALYRQLKPPTAEVVSSSAQVAVTSF